MSAAAGQMRTPQMRTAAAREFLAAMRLRMLGSPEGAAVSAADPAAPLTADGPTAFYDPLAVVRLGEKVLAESSGSLSAIERFSLMEQIAIAAIDAGHMDVAQRHLAELEKRFPPAQFARSLRLRGLVAEAAGNFSCAEDLYVKAIAADETNMALWRQSIARFLSVGEREKAIEALVVYVDHFMQDTEAWLALAKLYMQECKFQQAAFCLEELMMLKPLFPFYQIRYADVVASMGRLHTAVKYYASALNILPDHVRALVGLRTVTSLILRKTPSTTPAHESGSPTRSSTAVATRNALDIDPIPEERLKLLYQLAADRLTKIYESKGRDAAPLTLVVKSWIHENS